jgi:hypothetical protein
MQDLLQNQSFAVPTFLATVLMMLTGPWAKADDKGSGSEEKRVALAKLAESGGVLLARESGKTWKVVGNSDSIYSKDTLLALPADRATLVTSNKAVTISLWGNLPLSTVPVVESAIVLHQNPDVDLELTFERGRVVLTNSQTKGEAKVRVHVQDQVWNLNLKEPGTSIAFELFARMPAGAVYKSDAKNPVKPIVNVGGFVSKGNVEFRQDRRMVLLHEPPGPACIQWSSEQRSDVNGLRLTKVPPWIEEGPPYDSTPYIKAVMQQIAERTGSKSVSSALTGLLTDASAESDRPRATMLRSLAVFGFGAVDDVAGLVDNLTEGKPEETRELAIEALRHWLGRGTGKDAELNDYLVGKKKVEPKQAELTIHLLNGFETRQLLQAETYELLIAYVKHPRLAVRELAHWHLTRLVPDGNKITYDPAGTDEEQERAFKEWKKRVPDGKVPGEGKGS